MLALSQDEGDDDHLEMINHLVHEVAFTKELDAAFRRGDGRTDDGLKEALVPLVKHLRGLRDSEWAAPTTVATALRRRSLINLLIGKKNAFFALLRDDVISEKDFRALSILRTRPPETPSGSVRVWHGVDGVFDYAYEFGPAPAVAPQEGGDAERRCLLALTSALAANRPAVLSGPAGSGKRCLLLFLLARLGRQRVSVDVSAWPGATDDQGNRPADSHPLPHLLHCLCEAGLAALITGTDSVPFPVLLSVCGGLRAMYEAQTVKLKRFDMCGWPTRMHSMSHVFFLSRRGAYTYRMIFVLVRAMNWIPLVRVLCQYENDAILP
jgi:hypothetical protein